ncbi:hypothetical protein CDAR_493371 [Caerostris darwini]|uniref:Uncharacterized protein n=1 Tax=Caerostris darwini TaxID=1538125 RepID=A0AAV4SVH7_9ARAC|nr:hypothetical protein CDAR_493371 [Caerostris darwini]
MAEAQSCSDQTSFKPECPSEDPTEDVLNVAEKKRKKPVMKFQKSEVLSKSIALLEELNAFTEEEFREELHKSKMFVSSLFLSLRKPNRKKISFSEDEDSDIEKIYMKWYGNVNLFEPKKVAFTNDEQKSEITNSPESEQSSNTSSESVGDFAGNKTAVCESIDIELNQPP